jgi:TldD protein
MRKHNEFPSDIANYSVSLLRKLGAGYSEARLEKVSSNSFLLKNGKPEIAGFETTLGVGIRFVAKGCMGFVAIDSDDRKEIRKAIASGYRNAVSASRMTAEKAKFSDEKTIKARYYLKPKINPLSVSPEEKLDYLTGLYKGLKNSGAGIPSSFLSLSDSEVRKLFVSSEGAEIETKYSFVECDYHITVKAGNATSQKYWQYANVGGWEALREWKLEKKLPEMVKNMANAMKNGKRTPKGMLDVITGPEVTGIIAHESGGHPFEADRILGREAAQAGESYADADFKGTKMGGIAVNLVDDPSVEKAAGHYMYDDEGVKARRKFLLREGIAREFLHNRETAGKFGEKSNGSARACSYNREPIIRMSNTFFLPGEKKFEELVRETKRGVYFKSFNEWNIDDKRVNQKYVGSEAYLIENGRVTAPLRAPVLEIDTFRLYSSIDAASKDNFELHAASCGKGEPMQGIPVSMGGPSLRIRNVRLR